MPIESIETIAVSVPLEVPMRNSTQTFLAREYIIVKVSSDDAADGYGYAYVGTAGASIVRRAIDELLAPIVVGRSIGDADELWREMYQRTLLIGRRGLLVRAMSAINVALYDAAASTAGLAMVDFLGGGVDSVPAYASGGNYREGDPLVAIEDEISHNLSQGFRDHKIKVGGAPLEVDVERIRVAAELIGSSGRLAVDANNAYRTSAEAIDAGRAFEEAASLFGLWWFEEPLSPDDVRGHAAVAGALDTPIAAGETHQTLWDFEHILAEGAASIIQADAGVAGGIGEWIRIAALGAEYGAQIAPHWHANLHVHLAAATPGCLAVEYFDLAKDIYNFEHLITPGSRLEVSGGRIAVPKRPGLGIEFDRNALARYRIT